MQQQGGGGGWNPPGGQPGFGAPQQTPYGQQPQQPQQGQPFGATPSQPGFGAPPTASQPTPAGAYTSSPAISGVGSPFRAPGPAPEEALRVGFFRALFDMSFTSFVTTRAMKILYGLYLFAVALMFLGACAFSINNITYSSPYTSSRYGYGGYSGGFEETRHQQGWMGLFAAPFATVLLIIYGRVMFEIIVVAFRIAEHLGDINRKTRE